MPINLSEGKNGTQWDASWCVNSNETVVVCKCEEAVTCSIYE